MTTDGTEKRVDELSKRVDFGFEQVDRRIQDGQEQVDRRFDEVNSRFDRVEGELSAMRRDLKSGFDILHRQVIVFFSATVGSTIAGAVILALSHS